jgi:hypothetical protein
VAAKFVHSGRCIFEPVKARTTGIILDMVAGATNPKRLVVVQFEKSFLEAYLAGQSASVLDLHHKKQVPESPCTEQEDSGQQTTDNVGQFFTWHSSILCGFYFGQQLFQTPRVTGDPRLHSWSPLENCTTTKRLRGWHSGLARVVLYKSNPRIVCKLGSG